MRLGSLSKRMLCFEALCARFQFSADVPLFSSAIEPLVANSSTQDLGSIEAPESPREIEEASMETDPSPPIGSVLKWKIQEDFFSDLDVHHPKPEGGSGYFNDNIEDPALDSYFSELFSRSHSLNSRLRGIVYDDRVVLDDRYTIGEGIGNVSIIAKNLRSGAVFTAQTSNGGGYGLKLQPGGYSIVAIREDGSEARLGEIAISDQTMTLDIRASLFVHPDEDTDAISDFNYIDVPCKDISKSLSLPEFRLDTDTDGYVTPFDALAIINSLRDLNRRFDYWLDLDSDGIVDLNDCSILVDYLNRNELQRVADGVQTGVNEMTIDDPFGKPSIHRQWTNEIRKSAIDVMADRFQRHPSDFVLERIYPVIWPNSRPVNDLSFKMAVLSPGLLIFVRSGDFLTELRYVWGDKPLLGSTRQFRGIIDGAESMPCVNDVNNLVAKEKVLYEMGLSVIRSIGWSATYEIVDG